VFVAYGVLIEAWRVMLRNWDGARTLTYLAAARIWFVSNLGKYVPGKVWQIAAMSLMAQQRGISPVAATGSSLLVNFANVLTGLVVILWGSSRLFEVATRGGFRAAGILVVAAVVVLVSLPVALPRLAGLAARFIGRPITLPRLPAAAIWVAVLSTAIAWVLYGLAFRVFARALIPETTGPMPAWIAVYTASYLVGYLTPLAPGGIVVRETMLVQGMATLGLAGASDAWLLALASRLWLTLLEVAPGLIFLAARDGQHRPPNPEPALM